MRARKPCVRARFNLPGWKVRFMSLYLHWQPRKSAAKKEPGRVRAGLERVNKRPRAGAASRGCRVCSEGDCEVIDCPVSIEIRITVSMPVD
jgi:hypothetical protein